MSYLQELTLRLAYGASQLDEDTRLRHRSWLWAKQRDDGGFAGREGASDPYYTAFGLRGLLLVDGIDDSIAQRAATYLRSQVGGRLGIIDLISLVMAASILELTRGVETFPVDDRLRDDFASTLETLRSSDGGYAKTPDGAAGSTYQTFLNLLCYELIDRAPPQPERILAFLDSQRQSDGGFREIRVAKRAGVNPTAAGIGTLKTLGCLDAAREISTAEFLQEMQTDEGGLAANDRIPMADLLSSFTGLLTLADLDAHAGVHIGRLKRYARQMEHRGVGAGTAGGTSDRSDRGGFSGFAYDQETDVEYTFYGLGLLALCETLEGDAESIEMGGTAK